MRPSSGSEDSQPPTVLIVEDNPDVRVVAEDLLTLLGYQVISVEQGSDALAILNSDRQVDLIFTDIVLPGDLNGNTLMEMARDTRPGIKMLATSGYAQETLGSDCTLPEGVKLLAKPYAMGALDAAIRETLSVDISLVA